MDDEHRRKISVALKEYNARPDAHLRALRRRGPDHPNWKGGIKATVYQEIAFAAHGRVCNRCGSTDHLAVHHVDRNRRNCDPENLEVLCKGCHNREHFGKRVPWTCPVCGTTLHLQPFWAARRKFCSNTCRMSARKDNGQF